MWLPDFWTCTKAIVSLGLGVVGYSSGWGRAVVEGVMCVVGEAPAISSGTPYVTSDDGGNRVVNTMLLMLCTVVIYRPHRSINRLSSSERKCRCCFAKGF